MMYLRLNLNSFRYKLYNIRHLNQEVPICVKLQDNIFEQFKFKKIQLIKNVLKENP